MDHTLFRFFILGETGLVIHETVNIHCEDPGTEDYSVPDEESGLITPLSLNRTFNGK